MGIWERGMVLVLTNFEEKIKRKTAKINRPRQKLKPNDGGGW
jgi:hypothetical protein